jgi:hypothetical protein
LTSRHWSIYFLLCLMARSELAPPLAMVEWTAEGAIAPH